MSKCSSYLWRGEMIVERLEAVNLNARGSEPSPKDIYKIDRK
jgi:hypothetical protein